MLEKIKRFFYRGSKSEDNETMVQEWYDKKSNLMEAILGKEHDTVMHAIIPYYVGGGLDLYYYPHGIEGVAVATKELSELPHQGPSNKAFRCYEIAMFTKHPLSIEEAKSDTPFGRIHTKINAILNCVARYSAQATINPYETCEFPEDMDTVGGTCLIFDRYGSEKGKLPFGILAIMEIFRSEMEFARQHGGRNLLDKLKEAGYYPYSDFEREAVA